jgi:hypothetical protein
MTKKMNDSINTPYRGKNDTELVLLRKDYGVIYGKKNEEKIEEKKEIR